MNSTIDDLLMGIKETGDAVAQEDVVQDDLEGGTTDNPNEAIGEDQATGNPDDEQGSEGAQEGDISPESGSEEPTVDGDEVDDDEGVVFEDWDEGDEPEVPETPLSETPIFEAVKDVVGDDISSVDELKEFIVNLKDENSTLKEQANENPLENIPESLREAVELAKDGRADYLELLKITSVDYTKLDPATLAENDIKQYFYNDGKFDEDGFIDYIDNVSEKDLEIRGRQRINQLVQEQALKKEAFMQNLAKDRAIKNEAIEKAVNRLDNVAKFKIKDSQRTQLAKQMVNDNYKNILEPRKANGEIDYDEVAKTIFIRQNFDKMINVMKTQTRNALKGEVIKEIGNQTVGSPSDKSVHSPEVATDPLMAMKEEANERSRRNSVSQYFGQNK
jgi:hypothetical protein